MGVWIHQWKACERSNLTSFSSFSDAVHWVDAEILSRFFKKKILGSVSVKTFKNKTLANVSVKIFKKKNSWECSFRQDLQEENLLGMFLLSRSPRRKTLRKCFLCLLRSFSWEMFSVSPSQFVLQRSVEKLLMVVRFKEIKGTERHTHTKKETERELQPQCGSCSKAG